MPLYSSHVPAALALSLTAWLGAPVQALRAPAPSVAPGVVGSYEATRVNRKVVPTADRVEASPGYEHAIRLEEMVLSLRADKRFIATVKYHQSMVKRSARAEVSPVMTAAVRGRYEVRGTTIRFLPDADSRGRRVKPVDGELSGRRITVPFDYKSGAITRKFIVDLDRNENIW